MSVKIASFNIQNFSSGLIKTKNYSVPKDLETIANIITQNNFHVIAMQEILDRFAIYELLLYLDYGRTVKTIDMNTTIGRDYGCESYYLYEAKHWRAAWAKPISKYGNNVSEGYAFLWDTRTLDLIKNKDGSEFTPFFPKNMNNAYSQLIRPPFISRFKPRHGHYEIRLINTHIAYKRPVILLNDGEDNNGLSKEDYKLRKKEFLLLTDLLSDLSQKKYIQNIINGADVSYVPYTFLLGDYNLNLYGKGKDHRAELDEDEMHIKKGNVEIITINKDLTTMSPKPQDPEEKKKWQADVIPDHHMSNNFDHFSFDKNRLLEHNITPPIATRSESQFYMYTDSGDDTKFDVYKKRISDHVPIFIIFDVRNRFM